MIFKNTKVVNIPYTIDENNFYVQNKDIALKNLNIGKDLNKSFIISFGATSAFSEKRKGFSHIYKVIQKLNNEFKNIHFIFFGELSNYFKDIESKLAEKINHLAVAQLAKIAKNQNIPLIHISTDYVFQGQQSKLYIETDETNPINTYGLTKLNGEKAVISSGCNLIFNLSILFNIKCIRLRTITLSPNFGGQNTIIFPSFFNILWNSDNICFISFKLKCSMTPKW